MEQGWQKDRESKIENAAGGNAAKGMVISPDGVVDTGATGWEK